MTASGPVFDLGLVRQELEGTVVASPYPFELAVAIVNDVFRMGGALPPEPPGLAAWNGWAARPERKLLKEQAGMLAHALVSSSLRKMSVQALTHTRKAASRALDQFFTGIAPLTAEMMRANAFRQEEFLRRWIEALGGEVAGEGARQSKRRLEELDYRKTLAEYERAESARLAEAERRRKALEEAAQREADARGWRE